MTDIRSLEETLLDNLPWNRARIKFLARFLLALYAVRTVNLSILATAFSGSAKEESNYKRLQRFLRNFEMPYAQLAEFVIKLVGIPGPYTLALDRTNWKVGTADINILMLSIVYRGVGFPVVWSVLPKASNCDTTERETVIEIFIDLFGAFNIACLLGDREFIGKAWFRFLKEQWQHLKIISYATYVAWIMTDRLSNLFFKTPQQIHVLWCKPHILIYKTNWIG